MAGTSRMGVAISRDMLESLRCDEKCGICGAPIYLISELYDPFPVINTEKMTKGKQSAQSGESGRDDAALSGRGCCLNCFNDVVVPMRIDLLVRRLYTDGENEWRGFEVEEKNGELTIPMITLHRTNHFYQQLGLTACGKGVSSNGRRQSTRRNAIWTKLNCPECINKLHEQYYDFFVNYGMDEL